jgi:hypothetical protein
MMDDYSRSRGDGVAGALAIHLSIYLMVAAGFAFGLYELLQPARFPNPGLAAYKPPPATSVIPRRASNLTSPQSADLSELLVISTSPATEPDTDGRSMTQGPITENAGPSAPVAEEYKAGKGIQSPDDDGGDWESATGRLSSQIR